MKRWLSVIALVSFTGCIQWKPVDIANSDPNVEQLERAEKRTDDANEAARETEKRDLEKEKK